MELTEAQLADRVRWDASCKLFATLPGADRLIAKYGGVPSFHDGEVEVVHLAKKGLSRIGISIRWPDPLADHQVVVTLTAVRVLDVELEGFSPQNVIGELWLRRPTPQPDYAGKGIKVEDGDFEVELEPIYGLSGTLLLRGVEVDWAMKHVAKKRSAT